MAKNNRNREQIMGIACNMFREKGYINVSINDICEAAKISPTTFYYYFPTKEDLLSDYLEQPPVVSVKMFESILKTESAWGQLWLLLEYAIEHYIAMGTEILKQVIKINLDGNRNTFGTLNNSSMKMTKPIVIRGQENNEIMNKRDAEHLINTGWVTLFGILSYWCIQKEEFDLKKAVLNAEESLYNVSEKYRIKL